jgi:hypothetical protein
MSGDTIAPIHLDVLGSKGIDFEEGGRTGDMNEPGVIIRTVYWADDDQIYGGCISRDDAMRLLDFLTACSNKWGRGHS